MDQSDMNSEDGNCVEGIGPRVRYSPHWIGTGNEYIESLTQEVRNHYDNEIAIMADALWELEVTGAAPVLPDGKIGGNSSFLLSSTDDGNNLVVTKSGKYQGEKLNPENDVCFVTKFDAENWACEYHGVSEEVLPTSDSPMHTAVYATCSDKANASEMPGAILHGHALATGEKARELGYPVSTEETMCSTPDDTKALITLLKQHPYPSNKVFIRKGHGFMLLGENMTEVLINFKKLIAPYV